MTLRDIYERADNQYWAALIIGYDQKAAWKRYQSAVTRAKAMRYSYESAANLVVSTPSIIVVERIEEVIKGGESRR